MKIQRMLKDARATLDQIEKRLVDAVKEMEGEKYVKND